MSEGFVVWFTGISGTGKSTLSSMLAAELRARDVRVEVLDGDEVRTHLSKGLGFSREDRDTNVRRIGFVAKLVARAGSCAMTAAISPYRATRDEQRRQIGRFVEVYLKAPIPVLSERDPKGLYKKALAGEIRNFTGIDDPYEPPLTPEVELDTSETSAPECVARILEALARLGYLEPSSASAERALAHPHGELPVFETLAGPAPARDVTTDDGATLAWIASGLLAPLRGPLGSKDLTRVRKEQRLERGLLFDATPTVAVSGDAPRVGEVVMLRDRGGKELGAIEIAETFDEPATSRTLLAGPLSAVAANERGLASSVRTELDRRGAHRVAGMVTERPLHRGDEYLCRVALETCDAMVVLVASDSPRVRAAVRASIDEALPDGRAIVVEMPGLPGLRDGALEITRAVALKSLGARWVVCREEDAPLAALGERWAVELGVVVAPPVATFALASGETRSARSLPRGASALEISWRSVERALGAGAEPGDHLMSPAASRAWLAGEDADG